MLGCTPLVRPLTEREYRADLSEIAVTASMKVWPSSDSQQQELSKLSLDWSL